MAGRDNKWLNRFAGLTAIATFCLIGLGGLVTSHEAGMAVPDWPTSYGYNMFLFPISFWKGGIFYEHTHRLLASAVGLMTVVLAVWIWVKEERSWIRWLGVLAVVTVILQGVLGGMRVVLSRAQLGIAHGTLAQLFLILTCGMAVFTSPRWARFSALLGERVRVSGWVKGLTCGAVGLIFMQLMLGATMRHQHAGLAVPDFPLAYGRVWPRTDAAFIARINQQRIDTNGYNAITAAQIELHMAHRMGAVCILLLVGGVALAARREMGGGGWFSKASMGWLGLVSVQALLGAGTVWSNKAADVATLHVMAGAASLVYGTMLLLLAWRSGGTNPGVVAGATASFREAHSGRLAGVSAVQ